LLCRGYGGNKETQAVFSRCEVKKRQTKVIPKENMDILVNGLVLCKEE
jgi:hypothetical protein